MATRKAIVLTNTGEFEEIPTADILSNISTVLLDDVPLYFGDDNDFQLQFDSTNNLFVIDTSQSAAQGKLFEIREDGVAQIAFLHPGALKFSQTISDLSQLTDVMFDGTIVWDGNDLYLGKST